MKVRFKLQWLFIFKLFVISVFISNILILGDDADEIAEAEEEEQEAEQANYVAFDSLPDPDDPWLCTDISPNNLNSTKAAGAEKGKRCKLRIPNPKYPHSETYSYTKHPMSERAETALKKEAMDDHILNKYYLSVIAVFKNEASILKEVDILYIISKEYFKLILSQCYFSFLSGSIIILGMVLSIFI